MFGFICKVWVEGLVYVWVLLEGSVCVLLCVDGSDVLIGTVLGKGSVLVMGYCHSRPVARRKRSQSQAVIL